MNDSLESILFKLCVANEETKLLKRALEIQTGHVFSTKEVSLRLLKNEVVKADNTELLEKFGQHDSSIDVMVPVLEINPYSLRNTYKINHPLEGEKWVADNGYGRYV